MKKFRAIVICILMCAAYCSNGHATDSTVEQWKLKNLAVVVQAYMQSNNGQIPENLEPLSAYTDLSKLLNEKAGSSTGFTERYAFLPSAPKVNLRAQGDVQILFLEVQPKNDFRAAIWINRNRVVDVGFLKENELIEAAANKFDLLNIKPMGGMVPNTSEKITSAMARSSTTEYRNRVQVLAREGKIPHDAPEPSPTSSSPIGVTSELPRAITTAAATAIPKAAPTKAERLKPEEASSNRALLVSLAAIVLSILGFVVVYRNRKR